MIGKYSVSEGKWHKNKLTWIYHNSTHYQSNQTGLIDQNVMRHAINYALKEWGSHTLLTFKEVSMVEDADIKISFHNIGYHFDNYPFAASTLGHAFFPPDGRVHLNLIESWDDYKKLYRVLLHEFGHALGLRHSNIYPIVDIMFPSFMETSALGPDDIAGIQFLYGSKQIDSTVPTTTVLPTIPSTIPSTRHTTVLPTRQTTIPSTRHITVPTTKHTTRHTTRHTTVLPTRHTTPTVPTKPVRTIIINNQTIDLDLTPVIFILNKGTIRFY